MKDFMNLELQELAKKYLMYKNILNKEIDAYPGRKIDVNKAFEYIDEMKKIANEICLKLL